MVNNHFIKFLLGKQSLYTVFSNDSYDWLKSNIFVGLGLNPDYAPGTNRCQAQSRYNRGCLSPISDMDVAIAH